MIWLNAILYLRHRWQQIWSVCRSQNSILLSSHQIYNLSNTAWGTSAPWIGYPCRALELSPVFSLVVCRVLSIIFFLICYCIVYPSSLYSFWLPFPIFKLFLTFSCGDKKICKIEYLIKWKIQWFWICFLKDVFQICD
jgi:hypothetical protein